MKIDLCKIFGVEEGEEFRLEGEGFTGAYLYKIEDDKLFFKDKNYEFEKSYLTLNDASRIKNIIKLPKKKQFTDDELCILRNIDKYYNWIARTRGNVLTLHKNKPYKDGDIWNSYIPEDEVNIFNHLFNSITWEDEEAVFIDDYVERS